MSAPGRGGLRPLLFQIHLWSGLVTGLYMVVISLSGSVLVYRNELRAIFDPKPRIVERVGDKMTEDELVAVGEAAYPDHEVFVYTNPEDPSHAVSLGVNRGESRRQILFDPYTGEDLGNAVPWGWRATTWLIDFHGKLAGGDAGKRVNGVGAIALLVLVVTGAFIWWPGLRGIVRALLPRLRVGWKRLVWSLHGAAGAWSMLLLAMWALTGIYLCFPEPFMALADRIEPIDPESFEPRTVDDVMYWIAYVHFGRFGGETTKLAWALFGLVPPLLFGSGTIMWWNRALAPRRRAAVDD